MSFGFAGMIAVASLLLAGGGFFRVSMLAWPFSRPWWGVGFVPGGLTGEAAVVGMVFAD